MANVSIIIPTYNRESFLRKAIDSALDQTISCEVLVVDHGSTDSTPAVVASYGDSIRYIRRETDNGIFFAWLEGILSASGKFIHFTFDDDWVDKSFVQESMALFADDVAFVFTGADIIDHSTGLRRESGLSGLFQTGIHDARKVEALLLRTGFLISPGCAIYRREELLTVLHVGEIPLADYHYKGVGPDLLFSLMPLLKYPKFGYVNKTLAYFRAHTGSISTEASQREVSQQMISRAYNEARKYYSVLRLTRNRKVRAMILLWFKFWKAYVPAKIKSLLGFLTDR